MIVQHKLLLIMLFFSMTALHRTHGTSLKPTILSKKDLTIIKKLLTPDSKQLLHAWLSGDMTFHDVKKIAPVYNSFPPDLAQRYGKAALAYSTFIEILNSKTNKKFRYELDRNKSFSDYEKKMMHARTVDAQLAAIYQDSKQEIIRSLEEDFKLEKE